MAYFDTTSAIRRTKTPRRPPVRFIITLLICAVLAGCASGVTGSVHQPAVHPIPALSERVIRPPEMSLQETSSHTLQEWVAYALQYSPRITAAIARFEAAQQQIPQVTALPEPKLTYRHFFQEVETRVGPQQYAVGLSQTLPWLGKLRLQGETASLAAEAAAARVAMAQNEIIAEVASAWYELYYFGRALAIMRGNRDLVAHMERVARMRYGTGASGHPDVIRAQVELGKIENELASLADREAPLLARINAALNRPAAAPLTKPQQAPVMPLKLTEDALLHQLANNNPELQALAFDIAAAKAAKARARKDFLPDLALGIDYIGTDEARAPNISGSGDDPLSAALTITLPIRQSKYRAGVEAAQAHIASQQAQRDQRLNTLGAAAISAVFRLRDAERQIALYRETLLPKANESLAATQRAYSAGESSFANLIDVQRELLVFELAEVRAVTDHNLARTQLEAYIGQTLGSDEHGAGS